MCLLTAISGIDSFNSMTWLTRQQNQCLVNKIPNYFEKTTLYRLCVNSLILPCKVDMMKDNKEAEITLKYFCGYIIAKDLRFYPMTWKFKGPHPIRMYFQNFSLIQSHGCEDENLIVRSRESIDYYCGERLNWTKGTGPNVSITFHTLLPEQGRTYFILHFHFVREFFHDYYTIRFPYTAYRTPYYYSLDLDISAADTYYHIVVRDLLARVRLIFLNSCMENAIVCYDGPGKLAPALPM